MQILLDQRAGNPIDDITGINAGHAFLQIFILQLLQIGILIALDFLPIVQTHLLDEIDALLLRLF
ncbi:hypothetical protein D3C77_666210 [compost metagenome]